MNEKKYFRLKTEAIKILYAFPSGLSVSKGAVICYISKTYFTAEHLESDDRFEKITESEFLEIFHDAQNELTLSYHRQFAKENDFIKNEALKSEGY